MKTYHGLLSCVVRVKKVDLKMVRSHLTGVLSRVYSWSRPGKPPQRQPSTLPPAPFPKRQRPA